MKKRKFNYSKESIFWFLYLLFSYISSNYFWFSEFKYFFYDTIYSGWPRIIKLISLDILLLLITFLIPIGSFIITILLLIVIYIPFYLIEIYIFNRNDDYFEYYKINLGRILIYTTFIFNLFSLNYAINTGDSLLVKIWEFNEEDPNSYSSEKNSIDYDKIIQIEDKEWMTVNLTTSYFANDAPISLARTKKKWEMCGIYQNPAWCYYDNSSFNSWKNGKLYNWYAVDDFRSLCPSGWRVPSKNDWIDLYEKFSKEGIELDEAKIKFGWPIENENNIILKPSRKLGFRNSSGSFVRQTEKIWWTSSISENVIDTLIFDDNFPYVREYHNRAWAVFISSEYNEILFMNTSKSSGIPVRCVRDINK